jgi:hypothetical protein
MKNPDTLTGAGDKLKYVDSTANTSTALKSLRAKWPAEFDDGVRCGLLNKFPANGEPGGYPQGFHHWSLDKRNAWFAGFNIGYTKRRAADGQR